MTISNGHVIWAYEEHIADKARQGLTPEQIRTWLRDEWHLHVGVATVKDVLRPYGLADKRPRKASA